MKLIMLLLSSLCLLTSTAWGFHRAGEFVLPQFILTGDFAEDGHADILVVNGGVDNVAVMVGDGTGNLDLLGHIPTDTLPRYMATADINKDGHLDLAVPNTWGDNTFVYLGDGKGGFSQTGRLDGGQPVTALFEDFNEDGNLDLITTNPESPDTNVKHPISIFTGDGVGGFSNIPQLFPLPDPSPLFMTSGDFNSDGHIDVVAITGSPENSEKYVLLGDGTGALTHFSTNIEGAQRPGYIVTGDINGDAIPDLVVGGGLPENRGAGIYLELYIGNNTGNFTLKDTIAIIEPGEKVGSIKGNIVLDDLNKDNILDILIAPSSFGPFDPGQEVLLLLGDGKGKFSEPVAFPTGIEPYSIAVSDLNEDGNKDLVVSNRTSGTVSVLIGDGAGFFVPFGEFSTVNNDLNNP